MYKTRSSNHLLKIADKVEVRLVEKNEPLASTVYLPSTKALRIFPTRQYSTNPPAFSNNTLD